jgi:hypothetical protein
LFCFLNKKKFFFLENPGNIPERKKIQDHSRKEKKIQEAFQE